MDPSEPQSSFRFQVSIHAIPSGAPLKRKTAVSINGCSVTPLEIASPHIDSPLPLSFEEAEEQMNTWDRMFIEPDGSFVWRIDPHQLDGSLFDNGAHVTFVELAGHCEETMLNKVLAMLSEANTALMFQLRNEAIFINETDFRKLASHSS